MSHYAIVKVKIKNPNMELLRRAIENLAKAKNGEIVNQIEDYYGRTRTDFDIGIRTPKIYRGIGIRVNANGEVEFIGDYWNYEREVEKFKQELTMEFSRVALEDVIQEMNMEGENIELGEVEETEEGIKIKAYDYGMGV